MGYTRNGAWITFREVESGTLEPGKLANLIVLDRDVLRVTPLELFDTRVELTMFRGKIVFDR
jgi:predicted amidohydrolase YtcJ